MDVFYILFMDKIENSDNFEYEYSSDSNNESVDYDSDESYVVSESTETSDSCETSDDEDVRECASEEEKDEKDDSSDRLFEDSPNNKLVFRNTEITCEKVVDYYKQHKIEFLSTMFGFLSHNYLNNHMITGIDGVHYYGEAHLTRWNCWMHTLGMPFTIYGMVLWIPALFRLNPDNAKKLMTAMYFAYGGHYLRINFFITLFYFALYYHPLNEGNKFYNIVYDSLTQDRDHPIIIRGVPIKQDVYKYLLFCGLSISTIALVFQEIVGHWYGGDIPSRWEAIPNAILYAKYFSVHHLFY